MTNNESSAPLRHALAWLALALAPAVWAWVDPDGMAGAAEWLATLPDHFSALAGGR